MKQAIPKQSHKQVPSTKIAKHQPNWLWVFILILILFAFLAANNMLMVVPLLLLPFFTSDLSAPPVFLFNSTVILLAVGTVYWFWGRKQIQLSKRIGIVTATAVIAIAATLFLAQFTIPLYRHYQVTHVPIQMKIYLEHTYREPFIVLNAKYREMHILGDPEGVTATAYPVSNPTYQFSISQGYDDNFTEEYIKLYGGKIEQTISTQLTADLKRQFDTRVSLGYVTVVKSDTELFAGAISSSRSISLAIKEPFQVSKWPEYKQLLEQITTLLNKEPYDIYQYYIQIAATDEPSAESFSCDFLPQQRKAGEFTKRLNYCVAEYNSMPRNPTKIKQ